MADGDNRLLQFYGLEYRPDLGSDSDFEPTTADVMNRLAQLYSGPGGALRSLRDQIPESENALSILNMARAGLGTAANWLQGAPEIGPDTLAPLGLAGMGMALKPANALAVPSIKDSAKARYLEWRYPDDAAVTGGGPSRVETIMRGVEGPRLYDPDLSDARIDAMWDAADNMGKNSGVRPAGQGAASPEEYYRQTRWARPRNEVANEAGQPRDRFRLLADQGRESAPGAFINAAGESTAQRTALSPAAASEGRGRVVYRAGDEEGRGGVTFYSTAEKGTEPYARGSGKPAKPYSVATEDVFDTTRGSDRALYEQFMKETGHPGRYGRNSYPFWTAVGDFKKWLDAKGHPVKAMYVDENTGIPSVAVYDRSIVSSTRQQAKALDSAEPSGIRAYHGSPHDYAAERLVRHADGREEYIVGLPDVLPDVPPGATVLRDFPLGRQRVDKIGSGEGNQAYGHGLYEAEAEGVARSYRDQLGAVRVAGKPFDDTDPSHIAASWLQRRGTRDEAIQGLSALIDGERSTVLRDRFSRARDILQKDQALPDVQGAGRLYEVSIKANPDEFLDWDKPLAGQPEKIRSALEPLRQQVWSEWQAANPSLKEPTHLGQVLAVKGPDASKALSEAGIKGISYWDAESRTKALELAKKNLPPAEFNNRAKEMGLTRNYVVFSDKDVEILKKYGWVPIGMAGGGMMMAPPADDNGMLQFSE